MKTNFDKIRAIGRLNKGFIRTHEVLEAGIHNIYLSKMVEEGELVRCKRGVYMLSDMTPPSSLVEISAMIPGGIICHVSALSFHGLCTMEPVRYHVAIQKGRKVVIPPDTPITLHHFSPLRFETGNTEYGIDIYTIQVYNPEKVLCDIVSFRSSISPGIIKEAFSHYMKREDKNLALLQKYSKLLHVSHLIDPYMEVLV